MIELRDNGKIILNGRQTNFLAQEFLPGPVYNHPSRDPRWYLDEGTVSLAQFFRDFFGVPVYLNNWHNGGQRNLAGFRTPETGIIDHLIENGLSEREATIVKNQMLKVSDFDNEILTLGSWWSQHKFSKAIDPKIKGLNADDARQRILDNSQEFMDAGLTTLESAAFAPTWVHADRRITGLNYILIVGP